MTVAPCGLVAFTVMLAGRLVSPRSVSLTVTWKLPVAVALPGSLALQFTVVVPMGKVLPEAGAQFGVSVSPSSSVAVAV